MPDPNPYKAREAKAEKRKAAMMPISDAVNEAISTARGILMHEDDAMRLRAVHAISQIASTYVRIYEAVEIEARLEALEMSLVLRN